jgi:hypothetical protein
MIGTAAMAEFDSTVTMAPCHRINSGRNARVTPQVRAGRPQRLLVNVK